jgi:hypothetical protein
VLALLEADAEAEPLTAAETDAVGRTPVGLSVGTLDAVVTSEPLGVAVLPVEAPETCALGTPVTTNVASGAAEVAVVDAPSGAALSLAQPAKTPTVRPNAALRLRYLDVTVVLTAQVQF